MDIRIRLATRDDLLQIMDVTKRVVKDMIEIKGINQWDDTYPNEKVFENDISHSNLYVAILNDNVVGFVCINNEETDEYQKVSWRVDGDYLLIHRIGVDPVVRGFGIGSSLIAHSEKIAHSRGAMWMKIDTNSSNVPMNNLIKKMGYEYVGDMQLKPNKPVWYAYDKNLNQNAIENTNN